MTTPQAAGSAGPGIPHYSLVIDGRRVESGSGRSYETLDSFRQQAWATVADGGGEDVAVTAARRALSGPWGSLCWPWSQSNARAGSCQKSGQHGGYDDSAAKASTAADGGTS
jgi:hypothetical protein